MSRIFTKILTLALATVALPHATLAAEPDEQNDFAPMMELFMTLTASEWLDEPVVLDAIRAQNARTAGLTAEEILELDTEWRGAQADNPLIVAVINNGLSDFLRAEAAALNGLISEMFITDAQGLNVAATVPTSDYWQGDEAKHQKTFDVGAGAIHIGGMEVDSSTGAYQGQASMTITDPDTGEPIGAITIGLLPEML